jgi:hypothetical protein
MVPAATETPEPTLLLRLLKYDCERARSLTVDEIAAPEEQAGGNRTRFDRKLEVELAHAYALIE